MLSLNNDVTKSFGVILSKDPNKFIKDVQYMQKMLVELKIKDNEGHNLSIDGFFGDRTEQAITKFKSDVSLNGANSSIDNAGSNFGKVGDTTWAYLERAYDRFMLHKKGLTSIDGRSLTEDKINKRFEKRLSGGKIIITNANLEISTGIFDKRKLVDIDLKNAVEEVEQSIQKILFKNQGTFFVTGSIKDFSYGKLFIDSYNKAISDYVDKKVFLSSADLFLSLYNSKGATGDPRQDIALGVFNFLFDSTPGLSDVALNSNTLNTAKNRLDFVENTMYKYLIFAPECRKKFIEELENLKKYIENKHYQPEEYKQMMLNYIFCIIDQNQTFDKSKEKMEKEIKKII